ncbi:MAG: DUF3696 domain-containing protein [Planctomycetota bacterium]|nr:DUF3696 domain-containing protein [Planctomycetota bacterium]
MITKLSLENFKAFEKETFELGWLNVLAGLNSSGKSSVIQAIRLLHEKKPLDGLGPLKEYIRSSAKGESKGFVVKCAVRDGRQFEFSFAREAACPKYGESLPGVVSSISADRFGPKNSLPLNVGGVIQTVGARGENIVDFLARLDRDWDDLRIPPALAAKEGTGVKNNIVEWLRILSPGVDFAYETDYRMDAGRTEFNRYRPVHVGFGLSYALPIIASVLVHSGQLAKGNGTPILLLIENPEAHLHPSGQTKMGELLSLAASCGIQLIIETHSDHLMNGIRIAVKEGKLPPPDVKFYFFNSGNCDTPTVVEQIAMDRHGMMERWPDGFFDETEKNLLRLV